MTAPPIRPADRLVALVGLAAVSLMLVASLWTIDLLPMHDGPQHIFMGHLAQTYGDPAQGYAALLDHGGAITSLGFHSVFTLFDGPLSWRQATMATLTVSALLQAWAFFFFATRVRPAAPWLGVIGAAAAVPWSMYMGFLSFTIATALHWVILGLCICDGPMSVRRRAGVSLLLLSAAVAHIFAGALTGICVLVLVIVRADPGQRLRELGRVVVMGLPAFAVAVGVALTLLGPQTDTYDVVPWDQWWDRFTVLPRMYVPGPAWRWGGAWGLAAAGVVGASMAARHDRTVRALLMTSVAGVAVALALPLTFAGWQLFPPRLLPVALSPLWLMLPVGAPGSRMRAGVATLALGWTIAAVGWTVAFHHRLADQFASAFSGFDQGIDRRGAMRFQAILQPKLDESVRHFQSEVPFYLPTVNLGLLYAADQGGYSPYFFGHFAAMHPYYIREGAQQAHPPFPNRYFYEELRQAQGVERRGILHQLAATSAQWDDVVVYGHPDEVDVWLDRGFVPDYRSDDGKLLLAHFRGCPISVDVMLSAPLDAPLLVEVGWTPVLVAHWGATLPPGAPPQDGVLHLPLPGTPCGPTWVRVVWDADGDGAFSSGERTCQGSDAEGRFAFSTPAQGAALTCVPQ